MYRGKHISVIIPVLNEAKAIGLVIDELRELIQNDQPIVDDIVVCDNGSTDNSVPVAREKGARVISEPEKGYGAACLAGIKQLKATDIVVFVDGDHSCVVSQLERLLGPICESNADLVVGSRVIGNVEPGALTIPQRYGNQLAVFLIQLFWQQRFTDLGPFRAISSRALADIHMQDRAFGWTVEMQVKTIQKGLRWMEVPVDSVRRIGQSKISGTVRGTVLAGIGILSKICTLRWQQMRQRCRAVHVKVDTR